CHATLTLARSCYDEIRIHAAEALADVERKTVTPALERIVEAAILLSGLAFESGGLAAAHALTRGFTSLAETKHPLHGETVAFGLLVQLVLERRDPGFLAELIGFYRTIGLPTTLADLGLAAPTEAQLAAIARPSCKVAYLANMPFPVDEAAMIAALK